MRGTCLAYHLRYLREDATHQLSTVKRLALIWDQGLEPPGSSKAPFAAILPPIGNPFPRAL